MQADRGDNYALPYVRSTVYSSSYRKDAKTSPASRHAPGGHKLPSSSPPNTAASAPRRAITSASCFGWGGSAGTGCYAPAPAALGWMLTLPTFSFYAAWTLLLGLFACAYVQGAEFASTKETATVFGCVIGLAAFFSWLAVEDDDEDDEDDEDENSVGDGATAKQKAS